jgi:hypothetical protein
MQYRARSAIALSSALLAGALAAGCCAIGLGDCTYDLEIHATEDVSAQLSSLYVIVSKKSEVSEQLEDDERYSELLTDERLWSKCIFVAQYKLQEQRPREDAPPELVWILVDQPRLHKLVEHEIDGQSIEVSIDPDLVDSASGEEYCLLVVANYAQEGVALERVDQPALAGKIDQELEVGSASLTLRQP